MARMHSRRKGRHASHRPAHTKNPSWANQDAKEVEQLVLQMAGQGMSTALIGIKLRDLHNVPSVRLVTGKRINDILREHKVSPKIPEDLTNLIKRAINIQDHLLDNTKDLHNIRNLHLVEAKIRRLSEYYIRRGALPADWKYSIENAKLLLE